MRLLPLILLTMMASSTLLAENWPQWRGPNRDGAAGSFSEPARWPETLTERWKITVGSGHASPVLVGDRIYLHTRQGEDEVISALDAASGKVLWQDRYPAPYKMHSSATKHGPGPKSTPVVAAGRIYTLGISGILSAVDAKTGKVLWRKSEPPALPLFGTAMSPAVDGSLLIAHVGGHDRGALTAFDAATGAEKWRWAGDGPGYASPVLVTIGGTKQVITQSQDKMVGVSAASGELLWSLPLRTPYTQNSVTPVVYGDTIIYTGLDNPVTAIRPVLVDGMWRVDKVWENATESMYMSSPVLVGDTLYGMSNRNRGHFFALDARTGKTLWATTGREGDNAAIVRAGKLLFLLKDDAELVIARPNPASFEVIRRYTVAESPTWAMPLIDGNRLFIKDVETLTLWTVS